MANTTARPSGVNRYLAGPSRKTTDVNTQAMASVETSVGTAISAEPCSVASGSGMPPSVSSRCVFSIVTVESSTRMPMASARPPSVIVFECLAEEEQADDRRQDRQRDGDHDDERRPPRSEKQQDHERRQRGGDGAFAQHAGDGIA